MLFVHDIFSSFNYNRLLLFEIDVFLAYLDLLRNINFFWVESDRVNKFCAFVKYCLIAQLQFTKMPQLP
jgi:hypothetical protein